jgi:hypothetical protein
MKKFLVAAAFGLLALPSFADDIRLDTPSFGGNGCPAGSASAALSPDKKSLSILFDSFVVNAGGSSGKQMDRKSCNIAIPVHVPAGISVSIFKIDYRGFNNLPYGAYSRFGVEYFFAGTRGPAFNQVFTGALSDNYLLNSDLLGTAVTWSPCGQDVLLRANANMMVQTRNNQEAMSTVDSMDVKSGIVYHLAFQSCR